MIISAKPLLLGILAALVALSAHGCASPLALQCNVEIGVDLNGQRYWNGEPVTENELSDRLAQMNAAPSGSCPDPE